MVRRSGSWIVAVLVLGAAQTASAGNAIGKVRTDQTVYLQNAKMTVVHELTNDTDEIVTYKDSNPANGYFHYEIYPVPGNRPGCGVEAALCHREGDLQRTIAQYVVPGQTDSFAAGAVSLKDLPPGLYRVFVFAPTFKGLTTGKDLYIGSGTVFRITTSSEAGTIHP